MSSLFFFNRAWRVKERAKHTRAQLRMHPDHHIFKSRHLPKQTNVLKSSADAARGDFVRLEASQRLAIEHDRALSRRVDAGDGVEEGGFTSTVRADKTSDHALLDHEVNMVYRS